MESADVVEVLDAPNERLEAEVCTLAAQLAAATCRWLLMIGELDRREAYKEWGCASMAQWLSWKCALGIVAGRQHVRVARALERLPHVRARFADGVLSYSKVRALTRVATPATEASFVEFAEVTTAAQLERTVRMYERVCVERATAQECRSARSVVMHDDDDGMVTVIARLPRQSALFVAMEKAIEEVPVDPDDDSAESRRADALELIAETFVAGNASRPPTELVVHVDAHQLDDPDRSPVLERLSCDSSMRLIVRGGRDVVTSRRTRTIPVGLRRLLDRRDRGCRFPSCTHERYLHVHHLVHFAAGGATSAENCVTLCSFHHRLVHEGSWRVEGDSAEASLRFVSPEGRIVDETATVGPRSNARLQYQEGIDERTIDTADGGRLDFDLAITAFMSTLRPDLN